MVGDRRVFDVLFELLDPTLVKFQFQVSTIRSGMVAAEYFTKHPGRFISMHLQDLDLNAPSDAASGRAAGAAGRPPGQSGRAASTGSSTFKAAKIGGVQNYFVEMNIDLMKASVPYLRR